eukprot:TRINITY_DN341_c0_g1_i4.p1 TRINITY_DN341_c0_g1~~TRINITY_DN341_c0_g1_i4.p1  ORF type:complete len:207 (+),score=40.55 TRINITY_DN341_c0_g1_i4:75-695(+)
MIELQNLWNEIEDQLDDQDVDFPDLRESTSSSSSLLSELTEYDYTLNPTQHEISFIRTDDLKSSVMLPTTDNLLSQFFGEYAYDFDQLSEENDSDSSVETARSPSLEEEIAFVSISPKPARLPLSDELNLVIPSSTPTSPELSPDSPKVDETSTTTTTTTTMSPSMKRRMSIEDETTKRQRLDQDQKYVLFLYCSFLQISIRLTLY